MSAIIGRKKEIEELERLYNSDRPEFVAVYGRRRVGKTFLIKQALKDKFTFQHTGVSPVDQEDKKNRLKTQLESFYYSLLNHGLEGFKPPMTWMEAFYLLTQLLQKLDNGQRMVIFIDELPWLDTRKSGFLPAFEYFWNDYASTKRNIVFILCGSATSWMDEKITKNRGGLFNRQTCRLYLEPFTLKEVEEFLISKDIYWSHYEIAECYMIMGGIPYYLNLLDEELTLHQNIDNLFFRKRGELWDEFEHLYNTLFSNSNRYIDVVSALSEKQSGLTRNEICTKTGIPNGGDLSKLLKNLTLSGFVVISTFYGRKKKETLYQLADYYTIFYLSFIKNHYGKDEHFWTNAIDHAAKRAWEGLAFERICKDHIGQIKQKLGISGVLSEESSWFVKADEEKGISGAQIDLLIDRRDHVVTLCEIKFSINAYEINKVYDENLRNKIGTFVSVTNCKKTIQLVMITTYGVKRNKYSGIVSRQILLDDLFQS